MTTIRDISTPLSIYFKSLDHDFIDIKKLSNDLFIYKANDVLIQNTWELPIVIQWANSEINFKFETKQGDIMFGIAFVPALEEEQSPDDLQVEIIVDVSKVNSSTELVEGSFVLPYEGVVVFLWDNTFDWASNKKLSYYIEVSEPSFTLPDNERSQRAKDELSIVVNELENLHGRNADTLDYIDYQRKAVDFQSEEYLTLYNEIETKSNELEELESLAEKYKSLIQSNKEKVNGLCIRCLNRYLLSIVFSYIHPSTNLSSVCKYWHLIISKPEDNKPSTLLYPPISSNMRKYTVQQLKEKGEKNRSENRRNIDVSQDILISYSPLSGTPVNQINSNSFGSNSFDYNMTDHKNDLPNLSNNEIIDKPTSHSSDSQNKVKFVYTIDSFISYIDNEYYKIEKLDSEKRKVRRALKQWNSLFEKENNRVPTNSERKEFVGKLYEEYHKLSYNIRIRTEKINNLLQQYDLTSDKFLQLKQNPSMIWKGLSKFKQNN